MADFSHYGADEENVEIKKLTMEVVRIGYPYKDAVHKQELCFFCEQTI